MGKLVVAETILAQLGGSRRLSALIGAHSFTGDTNSLLFKLKAKALKNIKAVKVTLEPSDTYRVECWSIRGIDVKKVADVSDVYCDTLRGAIERETGLSLSL